MSANIFFFSFSFFSIQFLFIFIAIGNDDYDHNMLLCLICWSGFLCKFVPGTLVISCYLYSYVSL